MLVREQNFAEIGRFFGEKSEIGGPGKEMAMEKSNGKKSVKNREKSAKNRRFFGKRRFFQQLSVHAVHARSRRVVTDNIADLSTIKSKYCDFSADFRRFFGEFPGPWIFISL